MPAAATPFAQQIEGPHGPVRIKLPGFEFQKTAVEGVAGLEIDPARRGQVALVGVVRAFVELHPFHQFGNHEVQIGVALSMGVRDHVDGHPIHTQTDVRAVVEVETPQEQLLGLAAPGVLADK